MDGILLPVLLQRKRKIHCVEEDLLKVNKDIQKENNNMSSYHRDRNFIYPSVHSMFGTFIITILCGLP